jgi:O-antigen/teichoic acid export membrane protein
MPAARPKEQMVFKNSLAQSGPLLLGFIFSFLLAPVMISKLGLDKFGVWAVTGALSTYAGLLDLGVGRSLLRFIAVFNADGKDRKISECLGLGVLVITGVGGVGLIIVAAIAPFLSDQLGVLDTGQMRAVVVASVAIWIFNGYAGVFSSVGFGRLMMIPPNIASMVGTTVNFALSIAALLSSSSLVIYAYANLAAAIIGVPCAFIALRYVWRRPYFALPSRDLVKEVLSYSVKDQIGWLAELVNFQTDKVVIALAVGVRAAAIYEIASRVVQGVRSVAILTISAMVPTAASRIVSEGHHVIPSMYRYYTVRSCSISFPLFMIASAASPFLLVFWLGKAPGESELLVPFLTTAYMVNLSTGVGTTICLAAGKPGIVSMNAAMIAVANVILTIALAPAFGTWGVVGGTFIALTVGGFRFTHRFLRIFDLPLRDAVAAIAPPATLAIVLAIPSIALAILIGEPSNRLDAGLWLALSLAIYVIPYWILASRREYLPDRLWFPIGRHRPSAAPV